jgi:hypothetical protein
MEALSKSKRAVILIFGIERVGVFGRGIKYTETNMNTSFNTFTDLTSWSQGGARLFCSPSILHPHKFCLFSKLSISMKGEYRAFNCYRVTQAHKCLAVHLNTLERTSFHSCSYPPSQPFCVTLHKTFRQEPHRQRLKSQSCYLDRFSLATTN